MSAADGHGEDGGAAAGPGRGAGGARRRRRGRSRLGLGLLVVLGLLAGAELCVRVLGLVEVTAGFATPAQEQYYAADMFESLAGPPGYRNRPGARCTAGGVEYVHDAHGWRVPAGGPAPTPAGAVGVAFLGDSTTYGLGVEAADTLPALVAGLGERPLRPLNLGVNGYATMQQAALYAADRGQLGDDVAAVVLLFYPNDAVLHDFRWDGANGALYVDGLPLPEPLKPWLWRSALYRGLVSWHTEGLQERGELSVDVAHLERVQQGLERLARDVAADGRRLLVAHLPGMLDLDPYPVAGLVDELRGRCERLGVPFVDLLPAFLEEREREIGAYEARAGTTVPAEVRRGYLSRFWVDPEGRDKHLSAAANAVAARRLAAAVDALLADGG